MIQFIDEPEPETTTVEFVGGPRAGDRTTLDEQPLIIEVPDGAYHRSMRCADDGARRYVWAPHDRADR